MAGKFSDRQIAATMNRLRLRTGVGNAWNEMRVRSARSHYQLPAFHQDDQAKAKEVERTFSKARTISVKSPAQKVLAINMQNVFHY